MLRQAKVEVDLYSVGMILLHLAASYLLVDGRKPATVNTDTRQQDVIAAGRKRLQDMGHEQPHLVQTLLALVAAHPSLRGTVTGALEDLRQLQMELHVRWPEPAGAIHSQ